MKQPAPTRRLARVGGWILQQDVRSGALRLITSHFQAIDLPSNVTTSSGPDLKHPGMLYGTITTATDVVEIVLPAKDETALMMFLRMVEHPIAPNMPTPDVTAGSGNSLPAKPTRTTSMKSRTAVMTNFKLVCPHCGARGQVNTRQEKRKRGVSGGKATAAVLTGGLSLLGTGLSRKETVTAASCRACGMSWTVR